VSTVDLMTQIATLTSLRLLVRTSGGDVLEAQAKWRVNVGAEFVGNVARSVGFDVESYLAE
jgi:origin recognition complex subunit 5